jgi:hypothetical protein
MKPILILSVSVYTSCIAVAADATSSISGAVLDDSGKAVSGVLVDVHRVRQFTRDQTGRLVGEATNFSAAVITDANGNFTVIGLPSGQYLACAYPSGWGYLSNCEWNETVPALTVEDGTQLTNLTLTVRKGTVVSIVAADPAHLVTPPSAPVAIPSGHYFFPSVKTAAGYFSIARLSADSAGQHIYSVTIPTTATVELFFDSDLSVIGANGQATLKGTPSGLLVTGGAATTITVSLSN